MRDRQRVWCPRCRGTLLAPTGSAPTAGWGRPPQPTGAPRAGGRPSLPPGLRWVAVRPGAPPPPRRRRRDLGPTPRYTSIPRWGLVEQFEQPAAQEPVRTGPSLSVVRMTLVTAMAVLGAAAFVHLVRYILLIINRTVLLNPWVAGAATWGGVVVSVVAGFMVVAAAVVLTNWLIARRAAAFAHLGQQEPRSVWMLRAGCLIPVVNLAWAPVFVIELAAAESRQKWLRGPILAWWLVWVAATALSIFSIATSFTSDAQGIADNTVTAIVAYLFGLAAVLLALQVFFGFERQPVERPSKRWVPVAVDPGPDRESAHTPAGPEEPADDGEALEARDRNPAA
ncbi:hypothetical protein MDUV_45570 [Mycolicibacterium duvalii]|uniref:DUF4328 domain-containing protein n=1 Tax=Mycolicibacterium duvalii TaxID=39688 RepID=A0A7I7K6Q1_9MYCO|nr:hypothetical protein MDUV_45570 [Mycolicibacterium duvalii]